MQTTASEIVKQVESRVALQPLVNALLNIGESSSPRGILTLKEARRIMLRSVLMEIKTTAARRKEVWNWWNEAEQKLATYRKAMLVIGDPTMREWKLRPLAGGDKLNYFLARVTRRNRFGRIDAVEALTPRCYHVLCRELRYSRQAKSDKTSVRVKSEKTLAKLPNLLTIFVRYFPAERIEQGELIGEIKSDDIRRAIDEYAAQVGERRVFLEETRQSYTNQLLRMFGLRNPVKDNRIGVGMRLDHKDVVRLWIQTERPIYLDEDVDDQLRVDPEIEIIAYQQPEHDSESPYESAYRLRLGATDKSVPRAAQYRSIREPNVISPNNAYRLFMIFDRKVKETTECARCALLTWLLFVTGMPIKRLLRLRWVGNAASLQALLAKDNAVEEQSSGIYLLIEEEIVVAAPTKNVNESIGPLVSESVYRERTRFVPLSLGMRGRRYLKNAFDTTSDEVENSSFVLPRPKESHLPQIFEGFANTVFGLLKGFDFSVEITWSMIGAAFRSYSVAAGLTPLVSGIASGLPTRPIRTVLHYVAYDAKRFYRDHDQAVSFIESLINPTATTCRMPENLPASLAKLTKGCIGSAYVVRRGYIAEVWSAVCKATDEADSSTDRTERLALATIRAGFALMIATGIREQELPNLRRSLLDLDAKLLRVQGKSTYLREAREVPLPLFAVEELSAYLNIMEQLAADYDGDALFIMREPNGSLTALARRQLGFMITNSPLKDHILAPLRTLRHTLRTALHERTGLYAEVNEAFGHVTLEETVCHQLSGRCLAHVQESFRLHAERIVRLLLDETAKREVLL